MIISFNIPDSVDTAEKRDAFCRATGFKPGGNVTKIDHTKAKLYNFWITTADAQLEKEARDTARAAIKVKTSGITPS